jgi:hypothetical protein
MNRLSNLWKSLPYLVKFPFYLTKHFYDNSPAIKSRILSVFLKHSLDTFVFYKSSLSKDANPVSSNVIRESGGLFTTSLNAYFKEPYTATSKEIQDATHVLGQGSRLACKISFQIPATFNISSPVLLSRASNLACDSIGVMATDLSKKAQNEGSSLYYLWEAEGVKNLFAFDFFKTKVDSIYLFSLVQKSLLKAAVLDQVGELVKLTRESSLIENTSSYINDKAKQIMSFAFNLDMSSIDLDDNIYQQSQEVLQATNHSIKGYIISTTLGIYKVTYNALPDLLITGAIMLSTAKDALDFIENTPAFKAPILENIVDNIPALQRYAAIAFGATALIYKKDISSFISHIPEKIMQYWEGSSNSTEISGEISYNNESEL